MPIPYQDSPDERRRYYRIDEWAALEIRPETDSTPRLPAAFELLMEFHQLEFEIQPLLRQIGEGDRVLSNYLRLQNRRLDLLARALAQELWQHVGPLRLISLSEGGIRFPHTSPLTEGSHYQLRLLLPQLAELCLKIHVLRCYPYEKRQAEGYPYEIAARFEGVNDSQRQFLARYILQKQARERRLARGDKQ